MNQVYGGRPTVLTLERRQIDLDAGTIRLEPGTTKNDDGRLVHRLISDDVDKVGQPAYRRISLHRAPFWR
jgi:hypothetical protein